MECIKCQSEEVIKNGRSSCGKQTYKCKSCGRRFQNNYSNKSWQISDSQIIRYVKEGLGILSISRLFMISPTTVISRIKRISRSMVRPFPIIFGKSYEIDEVNTYVGNKKRRVWITYAMRRDSREVIDLTVGSRSKKSMKKVINTVLLSHPNKVHTDHYNNYKELIPQTLHSIRNRCTNRIERMNLNSENPLKAPQ